MLKSKVFALSFASILLSVTPSFAQQASTTNRINPCPTVSYMILPNGQCVDLSNLGGSSDSRPQNSLIAKFQSALAKINVPLIDGSANECSSQPGLLCLVSTIQTRTG